jgi:hypothetical protein
MKCIIVKDKDGSQRALFEDDPVEKFIEAFEDIADKYHKQIKEGKNG